MLFLVKPLTALAQPRELAGLAGFVEKVKPLLPIPALLVVLPVLWLFFRRTWRELDNDAHRARAELAAKGTTDHRPVVALVLCALILTMQEYYGGRTYFDQAVYPLLARLDGGHAWVKLTRYDELYGFAWWAGTRIFGYTLPFFVWKVAFRRDSVADLGLRARGFFDHAWIYLLFLSVVVPAMFVVSTAPDFGGYYPFYKTSYRSWFDFLTWEAMYFCQFFALEMFFRGFWLGALRRSFGSGAIFAMAVPYCMIHYGKPYLEACGAIVAGIALGSLSMKTKSIYQGFLVHITVAAMMDWLSLRQKHCTPLTFWPPETATACTDDAAARDALARHVDHVAIAVFTVMILFVLVMFLRARQNKRERV